MNPSVNGGVAAAAIHPDRRHEGAGKRIAEHVA